PVAGWAAGVTAETTRETIQRLLLGRTLKSGEGLLSDEAVLQTSMHAVPGAVAQIRVRHTPTNGVSTLALKSYEKGRRKWQGETLDFVWFDEEPPAEIYAEGLTRTAATGGIVFLTFTPLLGMSEVVSRFLLEPSPDRHVTRMTIEEAPHISPEERARILAGYRPHEREARARGQPQLGSGAVFQVPEEAIVVEPFAVPLHWARIAGLDFGWDHPTAAALLAWDRDGDILYVTQDYARREATPLEHAGTLRAWGAWLPWAWPQDGLQRSKDSGAPLAEQYRRHGLRLLPEHATFEGGGSDLEAGLMEMLERMKTGRWKVFRSCALWLEEFRLYHRENGRVVKRRDDVLSASRYAMMMRRHAVPEGGDTSWSRPIKYDSRWIV
ncbi:MAG: DNA packaging protein, partial [Rhodospirillales bacterium]|nr:DNA packaging protein [Rhodospirillales bacterium]